MAMFMQKSIVWCEEILYASQGSIRLQARLCISMWKNALFKVNKCEKLGKEVHEIEKICMSYYKNSCEIMRTLHEIFL